MNESRRLGDRPTFGYKRLERTDPERYSVELGKFRESLDRWERNVKVFQAFAADNPHITFPKVRSRDMACSVLRNRKGQTLCVYRRDKVCDGGFRIVDHPEAAKDTGLGLKFLIGHEYTRRPWTLKDTPWTSDEHDPREVYRSPGGVETGVKAILLAHPDLYPDGLLIRTGGESWWTAACVPVFIGVPDVIRRLNIWGSQSMLHITPQMAKDSHSWRGDERLQAALAQVESEDERQFLLKGWRG